MANELMWGYMIYLSNHIGADEFTKPLIYMPAPYEDDINTEVETWDRIIAFLAAAAEGQSADKCLARAVSYGSAACMTEGTKPPMKDDVCTLYASVNVEKLN